MSSTPMDKAVSAHAAPENTEPRPAVTHESVGLGAPIAEPLESAPATSGKEKSMAQLKGGKIVLNEKKLPLSRHQSVIAGLASFHTWMEDKSEVLAEFPEKYEGLLAMLVQDSDMTIDKLVVSVKDHLSPPDFGDSSDKESLITKEVVSQVICKIASRVNYGYPEPSAPQALQVWRWEVLNRNHFSNELRGIIEERTRARQKAQAEITAIIDALPSEDKGRLMAVKRRGRPSAAVDVAPAPVEVVSSDVVMVDATEDVPDDAPSTKSAAALPEASSNKGKAKVIVSEKHKPLERKPKKEDEKKRITPTQYTPISKFFHTIRPVEGDKTDEGTGQNVLKTEYNASFQPFTVRNNVTLAPTNRFIARSGAQNAPLLCESPIDGPKASSQDVQSQFLSWCKKPRQYIGKPLRKLGSDEVGYIYRRLKFLKFGENIRPAYFGTWSKRSRVISPRAPYTRDVTVLDYDVDSEEDWEEDEPGEALDSLSEDDEDMDEAEDIDEEEDGWLVPHGYLSEDEGEHDENLGEKAKTKDMFPKRRRLEPLVPVIVGPVWESTIGSLSSQALLADMAAHVFGDLHISLDPFEARVPIGTGDDKERLNANGGLQTVRSPSRRTKSTVFPSELLAELIKSVVGSDKSKIQLAEEFKEKLRVNKGLTVAKISEIAVRERRQTDKAPHNQDS
ncbi:chromatin assembly factor 1 subunit A-domain-containing protein [Polychytrium aggregatum]|uniref:chromatin assembly factor 1 subunit A-domain-containing protein n=1 Tax=Polychytrium aggregatum TaxID=110093 RepID=UPI0022FE3681|nr:chromatin assembly factor 1 subunit A-domain-containing protein [Polychytrium aggregatum]KAI9203783.1 chromatin assembly factor 1 subunit A-domain-containing protein [Polychytrium aggregatum]